MVNRNTLNKNQKYHGILFEEKLCSHDKYYDRDLNYY